MGRSLNGPIRFMVLVIVGAMGLTSRATGLQIPADPSPSEIRVLARGPIHEAYLGPILFNPSHGIVATQAPPSTLIEELPQELRPEGIQVEWIPGNWAWDHQQRSFLWVSGVWRDVPPGRQWIPGYWSQVPTGSLWTPGFWASGANRGRFEYLPAPPASLETGPNTPQPWPDSSWVPGSWAWDQDRYVWRPGSWLRANPDWVWTPGRSLTTPAGSLDIDGYWDYPVASRGLAFAPVAFGPSVIARGDFSYTPTEVLSAEGLLTSLRLQPEDGSYSFGNPADSGSRGPGSIGVPWFEIQKAGIGYDPVYGSMSALNARRPEWDRKLREDYRDRLEGRPALSSSKSDLIQPFHEWATRTGSSPRPAPLKALERAALVRRQSDIQAFRREREALEAPAQSSTGTAPELDRPRGIDFPRSPIASRIATKPESPASDSTSDRAIHQRVNQSFRPTIERQAAAIRRDRTHDHPEPEAAASRSEVHEKPAAPGIGAPAHEEPGPPRPLPDHGPGPRPM
ncbi:hypothetical protein P12x_005045 [Tundrisphaera lichenicola]|uniref:YXWGXW repeat-containing protein n=1 Tax=Tundrisphaera lichenicola TaxID=2029860 RepID=UPI003EBB9834